MKQLRYTTVFILLFFAACSKQPDSFVESRRSATIHPGYTGTYIPYNIAPLNFEIKENADQYRVRFVSSKDSFEIKRKGKTNIPLKKWKSLLEENKGENLYIKIFALKDGIWEKFEDMKFVIAEDAIDPYLAYRLIEPAYELWNEIELYQRCVENFEESLVFTNSFTERNCMNCHSFCNNDPETLFFHMRAAHSGTIFVKDGEVRKIDTKAPGMMSFGVYPCWHPSGRYVAFSTNKIFQAFLTTHPNKVEVFDTESDIVIYDLEENKMFTNRLLQSTIQLETFPEWSPDGRSLYFISAPTTLMPDNFESLHYNLMRVDFDPDTGKFGAKLDTIIDAHSMKKSVSLAKISPDGKNLVFCLMDFGQFPIWHKENDLYMLNLETGTITELTELNSDDSDSYHSWSSNGRWMVFSSRRIDGSYTRLYISYFDKDGTWHKPFILPQKDPKYYDTLMKSYNLPECITGKIKVSPYELEKAAKGEAIKTGI